MKANKVKNNKTKSWFNSSFSVPENSQRKVSSYTSSEVPAENLNESDYLLAGIDLDGQELQDNGDENPSRDGDCFELQKADRRRCSSHLPPGQSRYGNRKSASGALSGATGADRSVSSSCHLCRSPRNALHACAYKNKNLQIEHSSTVQPTGNGQTNSDTCACDDGSSADRYSDSDGVDDCVFTQTRAVASACKGSALVNFSCGEEANLNSDEERDGSEVDGTFTQTKTVTASACCGSDDDMFADNDHVAASCAGERPDCGIEECDVVSKSSVLQTRISRAVDLPSPVPSTNISSVSSRCKQCPSDASPSFLHVTPVKNVARKSSQDSHSSSYATRPSSPILKRIHGNESPTYRPMKKTLRSSRKKFPPRNIESPETSMLVVPQPRPVVPGAGVSLKDRLKMQLQRNASMAVASTSLDVVRELREQAVARAKVEAEEIVRQGTDVDIGPFYGLPSKVQQLLQEQRNIEKLYDWQDECLRLPEVKSRKNLIYSLPTSGGKTLVAEILILRELLCHRRDALLVLPFVAIVQEKVRVIGQFADALNFLVEEYAGSKGRFPPIKRQKRKSLYVATIEKAQSLVNSLIETKRLDQLGLVVVDELHMLGEGGSRGACLESTLLKLVYAGSHTQIVGMSATLSNLEDLQHFLDAHIYSKDFRPVELTEYLKVDDNIYRVTNTSLAPEEMIQHERTITYQYTRDMQKADVDHLLGLVLEVIPHNSCLIFCPTKKNCENVALMLAKLINRYRRHLVEVKKSEREALVTQLQQDGGGEMCGTLAYTLPLGIAYHHGGLTTDERRLLEDAYSEGILCLLACTSTLAAGVNLPAKRVILRSPYVGKDFLSPAQYKQMTGRAGRAGIDSSGESILIMKRSDREKVLGLLSGPVDSCLSSLLYAEGKGLRHLMLSAIGLQMVSTPEEMLQMLEKSLLWSQASRLACDVKAATCDALQQLVSAKLVKQIRSTAQDGSSHVKLEVTNLGQATFKGSVDLDYSPQLYQDLCQAEHSLVLATHLHLLYLVTPYDAATNLTPSWMTYFHQMGKLNPVEMHVASLIGVTESYITQMASGKKSRKPCDTTVVRRFYVALMLYELWKQKSVWEVADIFQVPRGFLQNLLTGAASFAACVYHFTKELDELWAFQDLLGNFVKRLSYCVTADLVPLMEIPGIKVGRARQLHKAGYRSLQTVAHADPLSLVKAVEHLTRKAAKQIVASAKVLLAEKAEALWEEVEELVRLPDIVVEPPPADSSVPET